MSETLVKDLFASDIHRHIEEVIKVDQADEEIIRDEIKEYVATDAIKQRYIGILERYDETPNKPHEGVGIWVSGFFGSGKSSFAKMLGLALENRDILGEGAAERFAGRAGDARITVLLKQITERIPTEAVIFDVSTDRGIRSGNKTLTEIMYRLFLQRLGYADDLDLAELEITLEQRGELDRFKATYHDLFQQEWDENKDLISFSIGEASSVMHALYPDRFPTPDSWVQASQDRADITPGRLAERCKELMNRRRSGQSLVFVVDEVGQFVARDVQKMLDLQAIVQQLGVKGRGRFWLVVTSQERLTELVGGLDDRRVELARLMDRFPQELQVHLEPSDIAEVTSKRVLSKNAVAEKTLRDLYNQDPARLGTLTRLSADIKLPELTTESFIDLYPLLPYHVDLIIQVVSGLRTQGGASKHVGGANRTIIKLAQQLLIHPDTSLAEQPVGVLVRIDQIYDLEAGNIPSEIRGKISAIGHEVDHPFAQPVAKAICLLQYVKSIHRTPENIAAALYPSVGADSCLPQVKEALDALEKAHKVRKGDDGYRIPSPVEDDWERQRASLLPKSPDVRRIHAGVLTRLWQPQPSHTLNGTKVFRAGLIFNGREEERGDIPIYLTLAEAGTEYNQEVADARTRSQAETKNIFWVAAIDETVDRLTVEVHRSNEILSRKERGARTKDETALVAEEKKRRDDNQRELQTLVTQACLNGAAFFRGNDRSPGGTVVDVRKAAEQMLGQALPEVFNRYAEAAAKVRKSDLDALTTMDNLRGLPAVFTDLNLVHEQNNTPVFVTDAGPLAEVLARIKNKTDYGDIATGRYLEDEFAKDPYGWDFDVVRLFTVSLLRAGKITAVSKGQEIDSALSIEAKSTFSNNNLFRSASFRPKEGLDEMKVIDAYTHFRDVFGRDIQELEEGAVARAIKEEVARHEEPVQDVYNVLVQHQLPGSEVLSDALNQMRLIRTGNQQNAILTFNSAHHQIQEANKRAGDLQTVLTETRLEDLRRAREAVTGKWGFLQNEGDLKETVQEAAEQLQDLLQRETFFREMPAIDQHAHTLEKAYDARFKQAADERSQVYQNALEVLHGTPGWEQLTEAQQEQVEGELSTYANSAVAAETPILQIRSDVDACPARLNRALEDLARMVDGNRIVRVRAADYFQGGVDNDEQLDAALDGLRDACMKQLGAGKKVLIQ